MQYKFIECKLMYFKLHTLHANVCYCYGNMVTKLLVGYPCRVMPLVPYIPHSVSSPEAPVRVYLAPGQVTVRNGALHYPPTLLSSPP